MSAVVLHVQGEITLKRRKTYAAACFHGCAIILTMTFGFAYFDMNHQPVVNALAVGVRRAAARAIDRVQGHGGLLLRGDEAGLDVDLQRRPYLPLPDSRGVIVPESQVNEADDSEGIDVGSGGGLSRGRSSSNYLQHRVSTVP